MPDGIMTFYIPLTIFKSVYKHENIGFMLNTNNKYLLDFIMRIYQTKKY